MNSVVARFEITGVPVPKERPRFSKGRAYKSGRQAVAEYAFRRQAVTALRGSDFVRPPKGAPLALFLTFVMPRPRSRGNDVYHVVRPDTDNLIKFAADCLNGLAWHDDAQVSETHAVKVYGPEPKTVIEIRRL